MIELVLTAAVGLLIALAVLGFELLRMEDYLHLRRLIGWLRHRDHDVVLPKAAFPSATARASRGAPRTAAPTGLWSEGDDGRRLSMRRLARDAGLIGFVVLAGVLVAAVLLPSLRPKASPSPGGSPSSALYAALPSGGVAAASATPGGSATPTPGPTRAPASTGPSSAAVPSAT